MATGAGLSAPVPATGICHCARSPTTTTITTIAGGSSTISSDVVTELLREAAMLGGLRHPNIVWVYGVVLPGGVRELKAKRDRWVTAERQSKGTSGSPQCAK